MSIIIIPILENNEAFNYFFSIPINIAIVSIPFVAVLNLLRKV